MEDSNESDNFSDECEDALLNDFNEQSKKRTLTDSDNNSKDKSNKKKKSNSKKDLYKQPTVEELNQLRETENLFHSNLFRIQIEDLLNEVRIKPKYNNLLNEWFNKFVENVNSIKESEEFEMSDLKFLQKSKIQIPFNDLSQKIEGTMKFAQPRSIKIIGSYSTNTMVGPELNVDVAVEIPPTVIKKADCENYIYFKKRAIYLAYIAAHLDDDLFEKKSFYGSQMKPMLKIVPRGKLGTKVSILIHFAVYLTKEKFKKVLPEKSNVKSEMFLDSITETDESIATSHYNSIISHDLTMLSANDLIIQKINDLPNIRDGIILLKIWMRQRELGRNFANFNSHVITLYVLYLLQEKKLNTHMSSYQIVRNVWLSLVHNGWEETRLSLCQDKDIEQRINNYKNYFDCVFLDITGYHNIAAHITKDDFKYLQSIANDSLECLQDANFSSFAMLFISKVPLYRSFETVVCVLNTEALVRNSKFVNNTEKVNFGIDKKALSSHVLRKIINKGFTKRLDKLMIFPNQSQNWSVSEQAPDDSGRIYVGMNFDSKFCFNIADKGPESTTVEAKEFRAFWGEKSELRHFQDGITRETVVWVEGKTLSNKRYISKKILKYLIQQKLGIGFEDYFILSNEVEKFLHLPKAVVKNIKYGTGEEATLDILKTFNEVNTCLRNLNGIPLSVNGAQGMSPAFRYTAVFPPIGATIMESAKFSINANGLYSKFKENIEMMPDYVPPLEVAIQLSSSGKWPDELEALRKMKAAFNLQIANCLRGEQKVKAQGNMDYIELYKNGYVFRLYIALQKEIALIKEVIEDRVTKYVDNEESLQVETKLFHLPKLNGALHGLHCLYPAFGPACCLTKRWLSAHLIDNYHFSEIVVELIMASIFLKPLPFKTPNMPQIAFLRFLGLCAENNWKIEPIIVNFNNELSREDVVEIENFITSSRESLPPLVICTPYDKNSIWTKQSPDTMILTRVSFLAKEALKILETQIYSRETVTFDAIFKPTLSEYDCVIYLKDEFNPLKLQAINIENSKFVKNLKPYQPNANNNKIPIIDFNPIQLYLKELREKYGEFALFFNDVYGGQTIAVLLKPSAIEIKDFKVTTVPGRKLTKHNTLTLNVNAILEGFYTLGQGLVENIEFQSKRISVK